MADPIIRLKRSSTPGKIPLTSDLQLGELAVNTHDGKAYLKKDVGGVETVVNLGGGYPGQTYYVTKTGLDTNDGQNISAAFATLKKALTVAIAGDTIQISSGTFTEIFPLTIPQGVTVRGNGIRSTFIQPTSGTERNDAFLLNGETTIEDLSLGNFYYNSSTDTGYGFKFAPNMVTTTRSPYIQRITVLNRGSTQTATDPYGFDTVDNYPTSKIAGRGVLIDASVVQSTTLEPAMLFNECTFITPNQTALKMTNGARTEWVNCFTYFASVGIDGTSGNVGVASTANVQLKLSGITTSIAANYVVKYYQGGTPVAIGTVVSTEGEYVTILGKGSGIFNSVGIGSTQDVRIFQSNGITQVGTASTILWADYQKFGADMRSIGSATNFGTVGVRGDGKGVQLRLFGFNFGCVGSGKTFTQDPTLTLPENEAIQLNGGRVYFQSVDQAGNFRIGSIFRIDQETGLVSIASTSDITLTGTLTASHLEVIGISTFYDPIRHYNSDFVTDQPNYNLINDTAQTINFAGDGTNITIGSETGVTTVRNYTVNLSGGQDSYTSTTGTLQVSGGVGISSNLNVGKDLRISGVSTFTNSVRIEDELRVAGVSTFVSDVEFNNNIRTSGIGTINNLNVTGFSTFNNSSEFDTDVLVSGITTLTTMRVTGISTLMGNVELNNALRVAGVSTFSSNSMINAHLNVSGITTTGNFRVTGVSTLTGDTNLTNNLNVLGITTTGNFRVTGVSTLTGDTNLTNNLNISGITTTATFRVTGISTLMGNVELNNALRVAGVSTFSSDSMINANLNVSGITTTVNLRVTGVSTLSGDTNFTNNLNISGITTTSTFRVTGISTLMGDVRLDNNLFVSGISTFNNTISHNSQLFITNQSTYRFIDTTTTTVTAFGDATNIGIGSTNATLTLRPSTVVGTNLSQNVYNTVASTVNAFGAATSLNLGEASGTTTLRSITLIGANTTQNLYNTVATTVNAFGAATSVNIGANSGTLTIGNPTVIGTQASQNLYNTVATTVNAFGEATAIGIGSTDATLTLRPSTVLGTQSTQNLYNTVATTVNALGAATTINIGANSGTLTLRNPNVIGTQITQNLYNTVATTVNAFGEATTIGIGSTNATLTLRPSTVVGAAVTQNLYNTQAVTVNAFGAAGFINIGANYGTVTIGNPTIVGTQSIQNLYNTVATNVNAFGAGTDIVLGATTGVTSIRNAQLALPNATLVTVDGANPTISGSSTGTLTLFNQNLSTINAFGQATTIGIGSTNATLTLRPSAVIGQSSTQDLYNIIANTVNAFGQATSINIGANSGTLTIGNPTVVGTQATQNLYNTVATSINAFGAATNLVLGATTGVTTIRNASVNLSNATSITATPNSFTVFNTNGTINAFGAASSLFLGATSGTLTISNPTVVGSQATQNLYNTVATRVNAFGAATDLLIGATTGIATVRNTTVSFPNATTFSINGANPTISGSSTGTLTLFNTNLTSINAFGAGTGIVLGATTGVTTIRNTTVSLPNATTFSINGANPTISGSSTGTLTLFNTNLTSVNAFNNATAVVISNTTGVTTVRNNLDARGTTTVDLEVTGVSTFVTDIYQLFGTANLDYVFVSGISTFNSPSDFVGFTQFSNTSTSGTAEIQNLNVTGVTTLGGNLNVKGDLQVDGTVTSINSSTLQVDDVNIELGVVQSQVNLEGTLISGTYYVILDPNQYTTTGIIPGQLITQVGGIGSFAPSTRVDQIISPTEFTVLDPHVLSGTAIFDVGGATDFTANEGGITLYGTTNKRFYYNRPTESWRSTENLFLDNGKSLIINNNIILTEQQLSIQNANITGVATFQSANIIEGSTFIGTVGNLRGNNIYYVGISSFNETYISVGIVTNLRADYFTLTNNETLITTQLNSVIGPNTNKIAIDTTGLTPEMTVYSSGTELLPNTTILSIDEPGIITITPGSINPVQTSTSTITVVDDPRAGVASITKLKTHVGIFTNFDTLNANITGVTTAERLYVNTDIYTPGISSANIITAR